LSEIRLTDGDLLLASASPRRRELLRSAGLEPIVRPVDLPEPLLPDETAMMMVRRLASEKAQTAVERYELGVLVLAADTTVLHKGEVLGKPEGDEQAIEMLMALRDGSHQVVTAITLIERASGRHLTTSTQSDLFMRPYQRSEVERYVEGGSPFDKAGGYGIQDEDFMPVDLDRFQGCFTNVMGLPLCTLGRMLAQFGYSPSSKIVDSCYDYHRHELQPIGELVDA
jgi:septum formation protein